MSAGGVSGDVEPSDAEDFSRHGAKLNVKAWWLDGPALENARLHDVFDVPPKKKGTSSTWLEFEQNL
jgi:hypothetical protein